MGVPVIVHDDRYMVEVFSDAVPGEEHESARLKREIVGIDVDIVVGAPIVGIELVVGVWSIPHVLLIEVERCEPGVRVKGHSRLGTI